jgi:uncharacterized membrane protein YfcA
MAGAYLGGLLAKYIPGNVLLILFALLMLITAGAMLRGKKQPKCSPEEEAAKAQVPITHDLPIFKIALEGIVVGLVTGLVGAGGGFLVVPALALLGGLPMPLAIGTSLLVIAMKSFAGFAGFAGHVEINYSLAIGFTVAAVIGANFGAALGKRIPAQKLRKIFAVFVLVMAFFVLGQQLGADALIQLKALPPVVWVTATVMLLAGATSLGLYFNNNRAEAPAGE